MNCRAFLHTRMGIFNLTELHHAVVAHAFAFGDQAPVAGRRRPARCLAAAISVSSNTSIVESTNKQSTMNFRHLKLYAEAETEIQVPYQ